MKAEEFAHEAISIEYNLSCKDYQDHTPLFQEALTTLFQAALTQPTPFVDGFVPKEEGIYKFEYEWIKGVHYVKVDKKLRIWFYGDGFSYPISEMKGRWSRRLTAEGGE